MKKPTIAPTIFPFLLIFSIAKSQGIPDKAIDISPLLIGERIPESELKNIVGETVTLKNITQLKPSVLIFYRGGWCPYCNLHLAELQGIEEDILNLGYQIIAISPDSP